MLLLQYTIGMKLFRNQNPKVNQLGFCVARIMIFSNRLSFERFSSVVTHVNERWTRKRRHEIEPRRSAIVVDSFVIRGNEIIISSRSEIVVVHFRDAIDNGGKWIASICPIETIPTLCLEFLLTFLDLRFSAALFYPLIVFSSYLCRVSLSFFHSG